MQKSTKAQWMLALITLFWGLTFPLLHNAIQLIDPAALVVQRFALASLLLLPFVLKNIKQTNRYLFFGGIALGVFNCMTYLFQLKGMETISASQAAFITGASVLMVPFIAPLFRLGLPKKMDVVCALVCLLGLYILTGASLGNIAVGDYWVLACGFGVALNIVTVQWLTQRTQHYLLLTFYQLFFTLPITLLFAGHKAFHWSSQPAVWGAIIFCAVFATIIALFVQIRFQQYTTASRVALIFVLEPVFAALFDWLLNGKAITHFTLIGGGLILLSLLLPEFMKKLSPD